MIPFLGSEGATNTCEDMIQHIARIARDVQLTLGKRNVDVVINYDFKPTDTKEAMSQNDLQEWLGKNLIILIDMKSRS